MIARVWLAMAAFERGAWGWSTGFISRAIDEENYLSGTLALLGTDETRRIIRDSIAMRWVVL